MPPHPAASLRNRLLALACAMAVALFAACADGADAETLFARGDFARAYAVFSRRAATGDLAATNYLGIHYYLGAAVPRDFSKAAHYFEVAAMGDNRNAQRNLGVMFMRGLGVKQDYARAYGWLYHAYAGGNRSAVEFLKQMADNVTPNAGMRARAMVAAELRAAKP